MAPQELTRQQKIFTLGGVLLSLFLAALDQTVVATAAPEIKRTLSMPPSLYSLITTAYLVSSTVMVPVYGKLSDLWGRRSVLLTGIVIFLVASVLCALSQTTGQLIVFRGLQGLGSASIFTTAFAVVADLFAPSERGKYSGMFGSVFGLSSLVGPLLGGFITDHFGWHWVFLINVPLGGLALTFIVLRMPALKPVLATRPKVDLLGAVLLAVSVVPLLVAASLGRAILRPGELGWPWLSWQIVSLLAVAVVGLLTFIAWELRAPAPLIELRLFRNPMLAWGSAATFVLGAAFLTPMVFLPLFMVKVVGVNATASGLTISPMVLGIVAGNVLSGQLVARLGRYKPLMLGALVVLMGAFLLMALTLEPTATQGEVTVKMIFLGLGLGPSIPLYTIAIQNSVPPQHIGVATSMSTFFRQMGSTAGVAIAGSVFATTLAVRLDTTMHEATAGLPPDLVEHFGRAPGSGGSDESGPDQAAFDAPKLKERVHGQLDGARAVAKKALGGDPVAAALVANSPLADERLKMVARAGGARAQVKRSFDTLSARIEHAASEPAAWQALLASNELAPELRAQLAAVPPEALKDPSRVAGVLASARQGLAHSEQVAEEKALQQAVAAVDSDVDGMTARVDHAIDGIGAALKRSYTDATRAVYRIAFGLAVLAFLLTLKLPQLPLRTTIHAQRPATE